MPKLRYDRIPLVAGDPGAAALMYMSAFGGHCNIAGFGNSRLTSPGGTGIDLTWAINHNFTKRFGLCDWTPVSGVITNQMYGIAGSYNASDAGKISLYHNNQTNSSTPGWPFADMLPSQSRVAFTNAATVNQYVTAMCDPAGSTLTPTRAGKSQTVGSEDGLTVRIYCQADSDGSGVPEVACRWRERPDPYTSLSYFWGTQGSLEHSSGLNLNDASSQYRYFDKPTAWVPNGTTVPAIAIYGSSGALQDGPAIITGSRFIRDTSLHPASGFCFQSWSRGGVPLADFLGTHPNSLQALNNFGPYEGIWIMQETNDTPTGTDSDYADYKIALETFIDAVRDELTPNRENPALPWRPSFGVTIGEVRSWRKLSDNKVYNWISNESRNTDSTWDSNEESKWTQGNQAIKLPVIIFSNYSSQPTNQAKQSQQNQLPYAEMTVAEEGDNICFINMRRIFDQSGYWDPVRRERGGGRIEFADDGTHANSGYQHIIGEALVQTFIDVATGRAIFYAGGAQIPGTL